MKNQNLVKISVVGIILLLTSVLFLPEIVDAKKEVERPFKIESEGTLSFESFPFYSIDKGIATHGGKFVNEGYWEPDTEEEGVMHGEGTATVTNGDKRNWVGTFKVTSPLIPGEEFTTEGTITFTGGTGRFENASGWFDYSSKGVLSEDGLHSTFTYTGEGNITY